MVNDYPDSATAQACLQGCYGRVSRWCDGVVWLARGVNVLQAGAAVLLEVDSGRVV